MNQNEYRAAISALNMTQVRAAEFLGVTARTSRRWALGEAPIPKMVDILLSLLIDLGVNDLSRKA